MNKEYKKKLIENFKTVSGKFDLYVPFIERGFDLLRPGGHLVYICPTSFAKRDYGENIRKFLSENVSMCEYIDFQDVQIFDSALNYTGIFSFNKFAPNDKSEFEYRTTLDGSALSVKQNDLIGVPWVIVDPKFRNIIEKMRRHQALGSIAEIAEGVVTGLNDLFLKKKEELSSSDFERAFFKRCLRGKQIEKYAIKSSDDYLFYPYELVGKKQSVVSEQILCQEMPRYMRYLKENIKRITSRDYFVKSGKRWYELWNQRDLDVLSKEKIVTPELSDRNRFALAPVNLFYGDTVCGIVLAGRNPSLSLPYLLGILNSKLVEWYYKKTTVPKANGFFIYKVMFLKHIPIPIPSVQERESVEHLVDQIIKLKNYDPVTDVTSLEEYLNERIYRLFGLTKDEIGLLQEHV